jgi:hypothetical protein
MNKAKMGFHFWPCFDMHPIFVRINAWLDLAHHYRVAQDKTCIISFRQLEEFFPVPLNKPKKNRN